MAEQSSVSHSNRLGRFFPTLLLEEFCMDYIYFHIKNILFFPAQKKSCFSPKTELFLFILSHALLLWPLFLLQILFLPLLHPACLFIVHWLSLEQVNLCPCIIPKILSMNKTRKVPPHSAGVIFRIILFTISFFGPENSVLFSRSNEKTVKYRKKRRERERESFSWAKN